MIEEPSSAGWTEGSPIGSDLRRRLESKRAIHHQLTGRGGVGGEVG